MRLHAPVALLLTVSCAGARPAPPVAPVGSRPPAPAAHPAGARAVGAAPAGYGPSPAAAGELPVLERRIGEAVRRVAASLRRRVPEEDIRLHRALLALGRAHAEGTPASRRISEALWLHGVVEPSPFLLRMAVENGDDDQIAARIEAEMPAALATGDYRRIGVAVLRPSPTRHDVLLLLQESSIEVAPLPRASLPGASFDVRGRVIAPFRKPEIVVTAPGGRIERLGPPASGESFSGRLACAAAGAHQVEVVAEGPYGATVLANFPLYCGTPAPTALGQDGSTAGAAWADAGEAEEILLGLVNRERQANGLGVLVVDARLAAVARAHSRDMREHGFVGHSSPTTGTASDRLRAAGLAPPRILLENVAVGSSPEEVHQGFLDSPAHRANVLSREVDRVGLGVVAFGDARRREIHATQLYARFAPRLDAAAASARLVEKARAARQAAGRPALLGDAELQALAVQTAAALAEGKLSPEAPSAYVQLASQQLGRRFSSLRTVMAIAQDPDDLELPASVKGPSTHAGIAAAPAASPASSDVYCIIILAGRRR